MKNPYETLGLSKTATQDAIKKAYRDLAKKHHPDLNPGNKSAETKFKELNAAYQLLGSVDERAKYDRGETNEQQQEAAKERQSYYTSQQQGGRYTRDFGSDEDGEDFFANLFRGAAGKAGRAGPKSSDFPGEDQLYQMEVDFKDAALGAERQITLPGGKTLSVKIPAGSDSGTRLHFPKQGGPGTGKAPAGDAYVELQVKPLAGFTRVGNTIQTELCISFQEGILGADIKVPTLEGPVTLKVRAGVSTGTRLGLRGKGAGSGPNRGYQIVTLKVVLPSKPEPALQEIIRGWGETHRYDARGKS